MNTNRNLNRKNCLLMVLTIVIITLVAIILCGSLLRVLEERVQFQLFIALLLGVSTIGIITILILYYLRKQQEELNEKQRIFLEQFEQDQRIFLMKLIIEQRNFEAEQINKRTEL